MTLLYPAFMAAGIGAAAAVLVLHLIMHRLPPATHFPPARFVPPGTARAIRRALRPDDVPLLLLRATMLLLLGAALSRPIAAPERRPVARIVALDRSRSVSNIEQARDSAESLLSEGDLLIVFDSTARLVDSPRDSLATVERSGARGNLSVTLVSAIHASAALREQADSVEIAVVTPATLDELDAATRAVRGVWPGRIRMVRVDAESVPAAPDEPDSRVVAGPNDPVAAAVALWRWEGQSHPVRLVRTVPTPDDTAWARGGGVLVHWPADINDGDGDPADSIGGVIAEGAVVVGAFPRSARVDGRDAGSGASSVAWWADGRPAAIQRPMGAGCIRDVAIDVPRRGDLVLRPSFQRLLGALTMPCDGLRDARPMPPGELAQLAGPGPLARASALPIGVRTSPLAPWLLLGAILLSLVELWVRRRKREA